MQNHPMSESTSNIDFNSEEWRRRVAEKQEAALRMARSKPRFVPQPRALTPEQQQIIQEAARLGAEWRARANQEGW